MNVSESNLLTFPVKLKRIVDAPETDHLIYWDEDGLSFHIMDENQLARDVIPNYFKHNNISSFIRQLNMYGFHKINRIENGLTVMGSGKDDSQWSHPNFIRDKPELLQNITRKVTSAPFMNTIIGNKTMSIKDNEMMTYESVQRDVTQLAKTVQQLKQRDEETTEKLKTLQDENNQLYSALMYLRKEHDRQSKIIEILIKFFTLYANKSPETRIKPKRVLALEMPESNSQILANSEPPKKFFLTDKNRFPQIPVSHDNTNSFKGKKVIKITNVPGTSHVDTNSQAISNNRIFSVPTATNTSIKKSPRIFTISIPKNSTNSNRAITAPGNNVITGKAPIIVPQYRIKPDNNINCNVLRKPVDVSKIAKTVTVSSVDSCPENTYSASYFPHSDHIDKSDTSIDSEDILNDEEIFNFQELLQSDLDQRNLNASFPDGNQSHVTNMISDISENVNSVGQAINQIKKCLVTDNSYSNSQSNNISDLNYDMEFDGNNLLSPNNNGEMSYHELKQLWDNIQNENFDDNFHISDPSVIQGNELIPFNNTQHNDWHETHYNYQDNFSIDDLLQTPEVRPEDSSLSLNGLKDSLFPSDDFFSNSLKS